MVVGIKKTTIIFMQMKRWWLGHILTRDSVLKITSGGKMFGQRSVGSLGWHWKGMIGDIMDNRSYGELKRRAVYQVLRKQLLWKLSALNLL